MKLRRLFFFVLITVLFGLLLFGAGVAVILRADAAQPSVLYIGDSMIAYFPLPAAVLNAGEAGDTSGDVLDRWRRDYKYQRSWSSVVLWMGTNDIADGLSDQRYEDDVRELVQSFVRRGIKDITIVGILAPGQTQQAKSIDKDRVQALNGWLTDYAAQNGARFVGTVIFSDANGYLRNEYTADGVHLNVAGYAVMQAALR